LGTNFLEIKIIRTIVKQNTNLHPLTLEVKKAFPNPEKVHLQKDPVSLEAKRVHQEEVLLEVKTC